MKLGRRRIWSGWLLLVGGLVIAGIWIASGRYSFRRVWFHEFMNRSVRVQQGVVEVCAVDRHLWNREGSLVPDALTDLPPFGEPLVVNEWTRTDGPWHWAGTLFAHAQMGGRTLTGIVTVDTARPSFQGTTRFAMVLWPIPLVLLAAGGMMLWHGKTAARIAVGCCLTCGYDLKGLTLGTACPECGGVKGGGRKAEG
ncbi:MAG: hypothetical protein AABZ53_14160 [Planctomycetota bacterium]